MEHFTRPTVPLLTIRHSPVSGTFLMRKQLFAASIAAIALIPSIASAQTQAQSQSSCERQRSTRVIATVAGAGVGGVLGNVIAGQGDKTLGTVIGAVGGAVIGNQIAKPAGDCSLRRKSK